MLPDSLSSECIATDKCLSRFYEGVERNPSMKRHILALLMALIIGLSFAGVVSADDHSAAGTPGDKNCQGQTVAYFAQFGQQLGVPGIGNLATGGGRSVKEVQAIVREYCAGA